MARVHPELGYYPGILRLLLEILRVELAVNLVRQALVVSMFIYVCSH